MRLRNVPGAREVMIENKYVFTEPEGMKGTWKDVFGNSNPVHIEIGMGKGVFITTLASQNPDINYVGIEKYSSVLLRAVEKQDELQLPNLRFIRMDAENINEVFGKDEVDRIYLNFSDPWPKDRHAKRRLTSRQFFARYDQMLKKEGRVEFKTDNKALFDFSVEEVKEAGYSVGVSVNIRCARPESFFCFREKFSRSKARLPRDGRSDRPRSGFRIRHSDAHRG